MLFEVYLVRRGLVTPNAFVSAVEQVFTSRVPIGRLAVEARFISMKQVFEILGVQSTTGERFGEIAVRLGYLTDAQLADLLAKQASHDTPLSEIFVQSGVISRAQVEAELACFRRRQSELPDSSGTPTVIPTPCHLAMSGDRAGDLVGTPTRGMATPV